MQKNKHAFTLVELLVVVLIIGVLSAIAIPMYQGAVDKSHWSTMLPGAKAIKDAEEAIKMTNGAYTDNMANLDVTMNNADLTFTLLTPNNTADPNVIRVTNSKLANVRLASYLDDSPKFAGQLHCEAATGDERATRLCEKLLNGQELTSADGYTGYLLDQEIDKATCDNASRSWSTSKTKCYKTTADRCTALGTGVVAGMDDQCGYHNQGGKHIGAESVCMGDNGTYTCSSSIVSNGGKCIGDGGYIPCSYSTINNGGICEALNGRSCFEVTVNEGGICHGLEPSGWTGGCEGVKINPGGACIGDAGNACSLSQAKPVDGGVCIANAVGACRGNPSSFINGAICYANVSGTCGNTYRGNEDVSGYYQSGSCCCGGFCPATAPTCESSRCAAVEAQYSTYIK